MQPGYALTGVGVPAFPKDQLFDYIHNVILPHYDTSTTNRLVYAGLLPQQWKGFTSGGKFIFKPDNAKTTTTYTFNAPTTVEVYNNGILGNPDDGNSGAIAAALGASICRSTLGYYPGFPTGAESLLHQTADLSICGDHSQIRTRQPRVLLRVR